MRAINLYILTREIEKTLLSKYEEALSGRDNEIKIRTDEISNISIIVDNLLACNAEKYCFENWFYSFTIPQIGKEFDLLKIGIDHSIINIELKSQKVPLEKIEKQLAKNVYYLSHISSHIYSYTCVMSDSELKIYKYEYDMIKETTFDDLFNVVNLIEDSIEDDIESLFKPKDYLISPLNTPQSFIDGKYYLNNQQEDIKKRIINGLKNNTNLWGITGSAGTGKTLLLYDIAKTLSSELKVGIVHSGILNEGHIYLDNKIDNMSVIGAKTVNYSWICKQRIIFVDETQRLFSGDLDLILQAYYDNKILGCIFSYDPYQALSVSEIQRDNCRKLNMLAGFSEERLSDRIRSNEEVISFIKNMIRLSDRSRKKISYKNIDVLYANNYIEADEIIRFYTKKQYTFISFTPSHYVNNSIDHFSHYINTHHVIGQEFDNVIMVIDDNFRYDSNGELEGRRHPNPDYLFPRLFYQNISRAREKLCLIILNNHDVFEKILSIKTNI